MTQRVMIVQILIAKRNAVNALRHERFQAMLDPVLIAAIAEAGCRLARQTNPPVNPAKQQGARHSR